MQIECCQGQIKGVRYNRTVVTTVVIIAELDCI